MISLARTTVLCVYVEICGALAFLCGRLCSSSCYHYYCLLFVLLRVADDTCGHLCMRVPLYLGKSN